MNTFASSVYTAGIIGGCIGGIINGIVGYFSNDTTDEYQTRILVGIIAGAAIAALGMAIAAANSTGSVMGALVGCIWVLGNFDNLDNEDDHRIRNLIEDTLFYVGGCALIGHIGGNLTRFVL